MKTVLFFALFTSLPVWAIHDEVGLFKGFNCKIALTGIADEKTSAFLEEARALGITARKEVTEYVERRKRIAYLEAQWAEAKQEVMTVGVFLNGMREIVTEQAPLQDHLTQMMAALDLSPSLESALDSPFFLDICRSKPPTSSEDALVYDIVRLRAGMRLFRLAFSHQLLNLPLSRTIPDQADPQISSRAYIQAQATYSELNGDPLIVQTMEENYTFLTNASKAGRQIASQRLDAERRRHETLEAQVLASPKVPSTVKQEIEIERDFMNKYSLPTSHPVFRLFTKKIADYFAVN